MDFTSWVLSIVGIVLLALVVDIILPEGQTNKYIKSIFAVITVFVIISPLPGIFGKQTNMQQLVSDNVSSAIDDNFLYDIWQMRADSLEKQLSTAYSASGIDNVEVSVLFDESQDVFDIEKIEINVKKAVIASEDKNINIKEKVLDLTVDVSGVSGQKVIVYE